MKLFREITFSVVLGWLCGACGDIPPPEPPVPEIYYRNNQGFDLLDSTTQGNFNHSDIAIKWANPDGTIGATAPFISKQTTIRPDLPYLPNGYRFSIDPSLIKDNKGNNGIVRGNTAVVFIQLNKVVTDTVTFVYSGATLQKFLYNKTLISPPANMVSYPVAFPVIITK